MTKGEIYLQACFNGTDKGKRDRTDVTPPSRKNEKSSVKKRTKLPLKGKKLGVSKRGKKASASVHRRIQRKAGVLQG